MLFLLTLNHIENVLFLFLCMAMKSWTLEVFIYGNAETESQNVSMADTLANIYIGESESTKIKPKCVHIEG